MQCHLVVKERILGREGRGGGGVLRWTINERMGVKLEVNNDL